MKTKTHKILTWLLSACMVVMAFPVSAFAATDTTISGIDVAARTSAANGDKISVGDVTGSNKEFAVTVTGTGELDTVTGNPGGVATQGEWFGLQLSPTGVTDITQLEYKSDTQTSFTSLTPADVTEAGEAGQIVLWINGSTEEPTHNIWLKYAEESDDTAIKLTVTFVPYATNQELSSIGTITGTAKVGEQLTAGAIIPPNVAVIYQWQRADSSEGTYSNIENATNSTYTLVAADEGKYVRVVATANQSGYTGSVTSASTVQVAAAEDAYTLTVGAETAGGVGQSRAITVGGTQSGNLSGKYLVVAITEGTGTSAKVSVVEFTLTGTAVNISYNKPNATVEAWIVSADGVPSFTGTTIDGSFDAHATTAQ